MARGKFPSLIHGKVILCFPEIMGKDDPAH